MRNIRNIQIKKDITLDNPLLFWKFINRLEHENITNLIKSYENMYYFELIVKII